MAKAVIEVLVEGGNVSPGPPLGPQLGPYKVNVSEVVRKINEKTKEYKGLMVPVKIIIDLETRKFDIEVKTPPTSQLILRELGIEKGSEKPKHKVVGNLTIDQVIKIARIKRKQSLAKSLKGVVKEVLGTCVSMGVTVEGKDPRIVQREIDEGKYNIPEE